MRAIVLRAKRRVVRCARYRRMVRRVTSLGSAMLLRAHHSANERTSDPYDEIVFADSDVSAAVKSSIRQLSTPGMVLLAARSGGG